MNIRVAMRGQWAIYATVLLPPHEPARPSWICLRDGTPWPCDVAQALLAADLKESLAKTLSAWLVLAARDMPGADAAELHERFVAWT